MEWFKEMVEQRQYCLRHGDVVAEWHGGVVA